MNIGQCVARVDTLRPNAISEGEKIRWAYDLDAQLRREFYPRYAPVGRASADTEEVGKNYILSASGPYEELYVFYVAGKVDLANQELELYNADTALFRSALDDFRKDYHRTHTHI